MRLLSGLSPELTLSIAFVLSIAIADHFLLFGCNCIGWKGSWYANSLMQ